MERIKIYNALRESTGSTITVTGWVRSFRANRFIALNDGSCLTNLQIVHNTIKNKRLFVMFEQHPGFGVVFF